MPNRLDLTGQRFTRWRVIAPAAGPAGRSHWLSVCDCGTERAVNGGNLVNGVSRSCGCLARERRVAFNTTHGRSKTPLFRSWAGMLTRCCNPNFPRYPDYGGRGIQVCQRWLDSFEAFAEDMGEAPSPKHSLDRIDNNGDYEPGNVRWATPEQQQYNKRTTVKLTFRGRTMNLSEWSAETGIDYNTIRQRVFRYGWSIERALTEEARKWT